MSGKFTRTGLRRLSLSRNRLPSFSETVVVRRPVVVVRRPVIVAPPPVVVDEYPVYAAPRVYAAPHAYAYAGPVWRDGWGHRRHFRGRW